MIVSTTPSIEGRSVSGYLGRCRCQGVLGVNVFKDVAAGMRNIFGGRSQSYENELASGVSDSLDGAREASGTSRRRRRDRGRHRLRGGRIPDADDQRVRHGGEAGMTNGRTRGIDLWFPIQNGQRPWQGA